MSPVQTVECCHGPHGPDRKRFVAGKRILHIAGAPVIQEQPLQAAIADVREWNAQLRETARAHAEEERLRKRASRTAEQIEADEQKLASVAPYTTEDFAESYGFGDAPPGSGRL